MVAFNIKGQNLLFIVLEAEKSIMKVPAGSVSKRILVSAADTAPQFPWCSLVASYKPLCCTRGPDPVGSGCLRHMEVILPSLLSSGPQLPDCTSFPRNSHGL